MKHNIASFPKRAFRQVGANMYQKYSFKSTNATRSRAGENLNPLSP